MEIAMMSRNSKKFFRKYIMVVLVFHGSSDDSDRGRSLGILALFNRYNLPVKSIHISIDTILEPNSNFNSKVKNIAHQFRIISLKSSNSNKQNKKRFK
jgi:hypothetical protein